MPSTTGEHAVICWVDQWNDQVVSVIEAAGRLAAKPSFDLILLATTHCPADLHAKLLKQRMRPNFGFTQLRIEVIPESSHQSMPLIAELREPRYRLCWVIPCLADHVHPKALDEAQQHFNQHPTVHCLTGPELAHPRDEKGQQVISALLTHPLVSYDLRLTWMDQTAIKTYTSDRISGLLVDNRHSFDWAALLRQLPTEGSSVLLRFWKQHSPDQQCLSVLALRVHHPEPWQQRATLHWTHALHTLRRLRLGQVDPWRSIYVMHGLMTLGFLVAVSVGLLTGSSLASLFLAVGLLIPLLILVLGIMNRQGASAEGWIAALLSPVWLLGSGLAAILSLADPILYPILKNKDDAHDA